ncbi:PAC2 family protein [bacterium]|nr:PAC2 family protein [bacterium]
MTHFELTDPGPLRAPALVAAFDGWVSAGSAGMATADHLAQGSEVIATFDAEALFDYRVNRPVVEFDEGIITEIDWPAVTVRHKSLDDRDILVLSGPEPNWGWRAFSESVIDLAKRLGVVEHVAIGGIPWATAHTRPTSVVTTASRPDLIGVDANFPDGTLRVPASVSNVVSKALSDAGIPTAGFWARVPTYIGTTYYPAVVGIVERLSRHLGVDIPLGSLVGEARDQRRQLDTIVDAQPQAKAIVERMESLADAEDEVISGEDLAVEIERFLRDESSGGAFDPDGG